MSLEVIDDMILRIQHRDGKQIVYLTKRTQTPIYEVPENLPLAQGAHIRFTVKRSVLGYKFIGVEEPMPKPPRELSISSEVSRLASSPELPEAAAQLTLLPIQQLSGTLAGLERLGEDPEIEELAESARVHGIIHPVIAMPAPGTTNVYLVVAGNRRVKAAQKAGRTHVPAIIRPYNLEEAYLLSLIENIHRKDTSDYDKGRILKILLEKFSKDFPNQEALAKSLGKDQPWISRHIAAYEDAEKLKASGKYVPGHKIEELPEKALRELRKVPEEERPSVLRKVAETPLEGPHEKPLSARRIAEKTGPEPQLTGDKYECPVCHQHFLIVHHSVKRHSFKPVRVA